MHSSGDLTMSGVRLVPSCGMYAIGFGIECGTAFSEVSGNGMTSTVGTCSRSPSKADGHITVSRRMRSYPVGSMPVLNLMFQSAN